MANENRQGSIIAKNMQAVKTIVRILKQSNWNSFLPDVSALIHEAETGFGINYLVVKSFASSAHLEADIIGENESQLAQAAFDSIQKDISKSRDFFPALEAVIAAVEAAVHVQKELEADVEPNLHKILPMMERLAQQLQSISSGVARRDNFVLPHKLSQPLCTSLV